MEIIDILFQEARKSTCRFRVSAVVLDERGNVLARGYNKPRLKRKGGGIHAEVDTLRKCDRNKIHTIVILRIGKGGDIRNIHPCLNCSKLLTKLNVKVKNYYVYSS